MDNDDQHYEKSLKKLSLQKLKKTARKLSISSEGNKQELIDRIMKKATLPASNKSDKSASPEPDHDDTDTYTKENLQKLSSAELLELMKKTFTRTELIEIILREYKRKQKRYQVDDGLKTRNEKTAGKQLWNNQSAHERNAAPVAFGERMATDYDKIAKERERIRELKKKRKGQNDLRSRNQQAKANNLWSSPHEKVVKVKELKQPKPKKKKSTQETRDKIADPVSREIVEKRTEFKTQIEHEHEHEHEEDEKDKDQTGDEEEESDDDVDVEQEEETDDVDLPAMSGQANSSSMSPISSPAPHRADDVDDHDEADDDDDDDDGQAQPEPDPDAEAEEEEEAEYY
mmetsp:Transcript_47525/g.76252  ORF Transcript_47525/g.76252 Transcript_47525/m.76252 type:complete len:344 (-) Transcript_47525:290-1321(-)